LQDDDGDAAPVPLINDEQLDKHKTVNLSGLSYKQQFTPYRPTREQLDASWKALPENNDQADDSHNNHKKSTGRRDKGKEKVDPISSLLTRENTKDTKDVKPKDNLNDVLYTGHSVFFEETDIKPMEMEFHIPESNADMFFAGFEPAKPTTVKDTQVQSQTQPQPEPQAQAQAQTQTQTKKLPKKEKQKQPKEHVEKQQRVHHIDKQPKDTTPVAAPTTKTNRPLEPEEEEIQKLASLANQGFIPNDEFERRKAELQNEMKKRHALTLEREREKKRIEAEEQRKLQAAEKKYKTAKLEEERLWAAKEKLRTHQMKLKLIAEEGLDAKLNFDDDFNPVSDPSGVDLDKILQCVQDSGVAMQIYEFLVSQQAKSKTSRKVKMSEAHDVRHILSPPDPKQRKINSMADVLHVLHVSGRTGDKLVNSTHPQLTPSQVLPTRENMHYIEKIANKDPTMVQSFLKQIKKERKLRLRYQQQLQAWQLSVSKHAAH